MPKRLGSSDVIRVLQEHGFVFCHLEGQPRQIQARLRTHHHRAPAEEGIAHRHHPLHHPPVGADTKGLSVMTARSHGLPSTPSTLPTLAHSCTVGDRMRPIRKHNRALGNLLGALGEVARNPILAFSRGPGSFFEELADVVGQSSGEDAAIFVFVAFSRRLKT